MYDLTPANDFVLVKDQPRETEMDGIALPDNIRQQEMAFGVVWFVGPQVSSHTKVRDVIYYGPYAGKTVILMGVEYRSLREGQIEGYVVNTDEASSNSVR